MCSYPVHKLCIVPWQHEFSPSSPSTRLFTHPATSIPQDLQGLAFRATIGSPFYGSVIPEPTPSPFTYNSSLQLVGPFASLHSNCGVVLTSLPSNIGVVTSFELRLLQSSCKVIQHKPLSLWRSLTMPFITSKCGNLPSPPPQTATLATPSNFRGGQPVDPDNYKSMAWISPCYCQIEHCLPARLLMQVNLPL